MKGRSEASEAKKKEVEVIKNLISGYKTVGLLDLKSLPSPQLQNARKKLDVDIKVVKKRLLKIALRSGEKEKLGDVLDDVTPALILTNDSSFKLAKDLRKGKSFVAAKPGQVAPNDIVVKAGPTNLPAGPMIGELGAVGIKASVEQGKIAIKQDGVVVKSGEVISGKVASVLSKLGIKPMEIGLNLVATFEDGTVFGKDVLDVDESVYVDGIKTAASEALNLSVSIGYVTGDNIKLLLRKVESEARSLEGVIFAERDKIIKGFAEGEREAESILEKVEEKKISRGEPEEERNEGVDSGKEETSEEKNKDQQEGGEK